MTNSLPGCGPADPQRVVGFTRVVACVGAGEAANKVLEQAVVVARALGLPLLLLRVCELRTLGNACLDPVDWEIRRREAYLQMDALVADYRQTYRQVEAEVLEGKAAEQLSLWAQAHPRELLVLGLQGECWPAGRSLGVTVREVLEHAQSSVLLVPDTASELPSTGHRRLLVPMDGSCRAESVLPLAMQLAQAEHAELLLVHVVPAPSLTAVVPAESEDVELCERLQQRNGRVAEQYLARLKNRLIEQGIAVHSRLLRDDVRSSLVRAVNEEAVDLLVLSAQGCSGRLDVPYGNVTSYIMGHSAQPLLIMRTATPGSVLGSEHGAPGSLYARRAGSW